MSTSTKDTKEHVEIILNNTFKEIRRIYQCHQEKIKWKTPEKDDAPESRLIFPRYGKHRRRYKTRISEQELRFVFVEQFNKYCKDNEWDVYYSVETPTDYKYRFSPTNKDDKSVPKKDDNNGRSASTDLTIHDSSGIRICLIEFKAHNPDLSDYKKDFLKLIEEPKKNEESKNINDCERFFIQLLINDNELNNVKNRLNDGSGNIMNYINKRINYHIYLIENNIHYYADINSAIKLKRLNETHPSSH